MALRDWLPMGAVPEVSPEDLRSELTGDEVQLVDVRTGPEFRHSRIPRARHLPIQHFSRAAVEEARLDPRRPVVAICLSAHRSIPAVRRLRKMGYEARQLKGGMRAWWRAGLPTEKD